MSDLKRGISRRRVVKTGMAGILATGVSPLILSKGAWAQEFCNAPTGDTVTLGFNVPQTGAYADEGADELRAYQLAVEHLNGEGDGGLIPHFSSKTLTGNGILGKRVEYVTGDTQTQSDPARESPHDRARWRRDDHWRFVVRCGDCRAKPLSGHGRHLHGRPDPFERHHG